MAVEACTYRTARCDVAGWHEPDADRELADLTRIIADLLTEAVTATLPTGWQGPYSDERAADWIAARDREGTVLLARERATGVPIGLVVLAEDESAHPEVVVRLGYIVAEHSWGCGFATEIVGGFVQWCRGRPGIRSIVAGVAPGHDASRRVLDKLGFLVGEGVAPDTVELTLTVD